MMVLLKVLKIQNLIIVLGVQWHPEFLIDKKDIEIFKGLIESSKKN